MLHISKNKKRHSGSATLIRFCASDSFLTLVLYKFIYLLTYLQTSSPQEENLLEANKKDTIQRKLETKRSLFK